MSLWKVVLAVVILFVLVLIIAWLTKGGVITEYTGLAFVVFTFFIIFGWLFLSFVIKLKRGGQEANDLPTSGIDSYIRKINRILLSRPGGEPIQWEGGKYTRYDKKTLFDINRQPHHYVAITGLFSKSDKRIILIYDIEEDDICRLIGDPSPQLVNNPFYDFRPFETGTRAFSPFPSDFYDDRYMRRQGVNINVGNSRKDNFDYDFDNNNASELDKLKK